ncbi:bifunctional tRNA (5-methylaminomethyl-2-thiouridine)(34)-methyltransferase MnmD/FAD-dependent 5-carboxymethylaminomethyl-2-thiouridine(34) oxidoreductase MnmC [Pontibacterium granulatum]|uniref:bifunctional tRNA (5-methylaminomethyl-2-thiouridine)(34)-methyltransferase MnmD/FAD-dependent 5-carboxymethylaminomethyl-2-thiouridine(34) oxidoreductase MnmC n=1 Tax=Pontibacterium granulatum TaxID=2036029 RepID=UPI002499B84E|nr:bifunctional tRNA (5-methylaminomethyl-2-thiouridine)(34)-methyltransferase MnmD/FAD-dependent 5-carboxymethylaminomethyl-2-thiouridine(34) oxidoreductase MnmC [Pontibacterium granulatum]MDI3322846.1 bifunctional tRNA (5-methylaminomethyl-2-thiouridine)(34)-methyltransferase MnmD/FAD-dependent 5-carboxymethylaminomethyl-2-thiouridine(34) oxidoreductase MnmC [Pontibacterium granulatum]
MPHSAPIRNAAITWKEDTPVSTEFDDMYFNIQAGLAECEHVFLNGNNLKERFTNLKASQFVIAETGFGTGLNFLAARQLWLEHAPENACLHFISVEKFPLSQDDLTQALKHWPELKDGASQLIRLYPQPVPGFHRLSLDGGRIQLTLMLMDALDAYSQLEARVDAWFLDGFAPSKNPEMWNERLFSQLGRLSKETTTLATFTAAGFVRRGLQEVGFDIEKVPGFGRKREMISARFSLAPSRSHVKAPWFEHTKTQPRPNAVVIIGAGIAGCATAYALAQRGIAVTLLERSEQIAQAGSGNRQGALYAKLPVDHNAQGQLHLSGLMHTRRQLKQLDPQSKIWGDSGLLQLATNEKEHKRQQNMLARTQFDGNIIREVSAEEASRLAGSTVSHPGVFMEYGGWVSPQDLCLRLVDHPLISVQTHTQVSGVTQNPETKHWSISVKGGSTLETGYLVICTAAEAKQLTQFVHLPIKPIRGQTSIASASGRPALKTVVCGDGYISPAREATYCFGATFDLHDLDLDIREEDHHANLGKLHAVLPEIANSLATEELTGRAAYRCSTADYLPIAGPAPDYEAFLSDYAKLRIDRKWKFADSQPKHLEGLFINIGHGSKGLITGPICGEIVAASMLGEPFPVEKSLVDAVNPARFIIKNLIRKSI